MSKYTNEDNDKKVEVAKIIADLIKKYAENLKKKEEIGGDK